MKYLSLFSGIEAATVAWHPLEWFPVGFAEIEPFPCAVLKHHYPNVPNLGSVTDITEAMIKKLGPIYLVVFDSPCQDLSVAGKRKGFDGERSGLFFAAIQIIRWARKYVNCHFALWENVPGGFSSNQGKDFAEVLRLLTGTDQSCPEKWRYAGVSFGKEGLVEWRVCDAQFYGVPQRRRRVFALADFGDWTCREPILFESEGLLRDSEPGAETWENCTAEIGTGIEASGLTGSLSAYDMTAFGQYGPGKTSSTLKQRDYKDATDLVVFEPGAMSRLGGHWSSELSPCLRVHMGDNHPTIAFNPKDDPVHSETQATRHSGKRGGLFTSDEERAKAELSLNHQLQPHILQALANIEEAKHPSVFVSGWRPALGWLCVFILAWTWIVRDLVIIVLMLVDKSKVVQQLPAADTSTVITLLLCLLGFGGARTLEKLKGVAKR